MMLLAKVNWSFCKKGLVGYFHAKKDSTDNYMGQIAFKVIRSPQVSRKDLNIQTEYLERGCIGP